MTNDLISREKVLKLASPFTQYDEGGWGMDVRAVTVEDIESIPAVDAVPVVHGRWDEPTGFEDGFWVCSACNYCTEATAAPTLYKYCPNCGARMDKEESDV